MCDRCYLRPWTVREPAAHIPEMDSKKVEEVAVTYSSGASSSSVSASSDLADLTETDFGLQLLSLLCMYARPVYVP